MKIDTLLVGSTKWFKTPKGRACHYKSNERYRKEMRCKLMNLLGGKCIKCGIQDQRCLQFDHINGGGNQDRYKFKTTILMILYYLKNMEEAKKEIQILCANCNWIKRYELKEF